MVTNSPKRNLFSRIFRRNTIPKIPNISNKPRNTTPVKPTEQKSGRTPNTGPKPHLMFDQNEKNWAQKLFARNK